MANNEQQNNIHQNSQDGPPVWGDEPPLESYMDNMPPGAYDDDSIIYNLPDDIPDNTPVSQEKSPLTYLNQNPEVYAYPKSVKEFNKIIKFGDGLNFDAAKVHQKEMMSNRYPTSSRTQSASANSQTKDSTQVKTSESLNKSSNSATPPAVAAAPILKTGGRFSKPANNENTTTPKNEMAQESREQKTSSYQNQPAPANDKNAPETRAKPQNITNNIVFLDSTPLLLVMEHFINFYSSDVKATHVKGNIFNMCGYEISINSETNKWFNVNTRRGNTNALSLAREIIAIHKDLNLNDKEVFRAVASDSVKEISHIQKNIEKYSNFEDLIQLTKSEVKANREKTPEEAQIEKEKQIAHAATLEEEKAKKDAMWKDMREQLDAISLKDVVEWIGASPNEDGQTNLWKIFSTGHNVAINGQSWKNWNYGKGGRGAISFMKQYISITESIPETEDKVLFLKAFNALVKEFGENTGTYNIGEITYKNSFNFPHILPGKTAAVKEYLNEKRSIPLWLINKQISNGVLFAGYPSDQTPHKLLQDSANMPNSSVWATFLAPSGLAAEMRGIDNNKLMLKGLAKGSDKVSGGYLVSAEPAYNEGILCIMEASIDATSYVALYPGRNSTSIMGVTVELAVDLAFEADEMGLKSYIGFDNDFAGNNATYEFHKKIQSQLDENTDYQSYLDSGKIKYFELAGQILKESIKKGVPFYFNMNSTPDGLSTADLFLSSILMDMPKDEVRDHLIKGRLKINNVCPIWKQMKDPDLEAKIAVDLLKTKSRYYYYPEEIDDLKIRENDRSMSPEQQQKRVEIHEADLAKRLQFIAAFEKYAGPENLMLWKKDRRITDNIEPLAKDWNEWMKYQVANFPEVRKSFEAREIEFKHYEKKAFSMKAKDLGNHEIMRKSLKP